MSQSNNPHHLDQDPEQSMDRWEGEGGAQGETVIRLPDGITCRMVPEYRVGAYRYTDLASAINERNRQIQSSKGDCDGVPISPKAEGLRSR